MANLLSLIQQTCDRLSLTRPSAVFSSTDRQVRQLLGIMTEVGADLSTRGDPAWQSLTAEWTFVTVAQEEQTNTPIPEDFGSFIPGTFFNRTQMRELQGPLTAREYQLVKARPTILAVYLTFRERQGSFLINPTPTAGETIAYEYLSNYWVKSSSGQPKAAFTADEDETYLEDELMILGLKWRYKQAKGLDYGEDLASFERSVAMSLGGDGGKPDLSLSGIRRLPDYIANVPEGSWPTS